MAATDDLAALLPSGYVLVRELARVPMRLTVLVEHGESGERAVVVVPAPELVEHVEQRDRLRRHADAVAVLNHPHILPLRASDESVTRLATGVPPDVELAALLPGASPPAAFLPVLAGVADALDAARRIGCYHGDLCAEDVLVDLRTGHACLSGFGVSPAAESAEDGAALDVEELGSLMVQCIDGLPPTGTPPPPGLAEVLDRAATEDPARLYPSCRAMIDAAAAILLPPAPAPVPALRQADRARPRDPRATRRFRLIIGSVLAVVLLVIVSVVGGPWVLSHWSPTSAELARMPAVVRVDCNLTDRSGQVPNASRQLRCRDLAGQELTAGLYDSVPDAEAGYRAAIAATPGARTGDGDCAASPGWEHAYPGVGAAAGRVLCVRDNSGARMVWLDRADRTVSTATRTDGNAVTLYQAWARWVQIPEFPTAEEKTVIDQQGQQSCRRAPAGVLDTFDGVVVALECASAGDGVSSARFLRFVDADHLHRAYESTLAARGIHGTSSCALPTDVGDDDWQAATATFGRLACGQTESGPTFIWMLEPFQTMGVATAGDRGQLNRWFATAGQPNPDLLFPELNRRSTPPFPTPDEASIIGKVPLGADKICVRPSAEKIRGDVLDAQVVAVACWDQKTPSPVYFYRYADRQRFAKDVGNGGARSCETTPPGFFGTARYSRPSGATGVLTCFVTETKASVLVWSDDRTGVLAATAVPTNPAKQAELIAWWKANVN